MKFPQSSLDDLFDFLAHEKLTHHIKSWRLHSRTLSQNFRRFGSGDFELLPFLSLNDPTDKNAFEQFDWFFHVGSHIDIHIKFWLIFPSLQQGDSWGLLEFLTDCKNLQKIKNPPPLQKILNSHFIYRLAIPYFFAAVPIFLHILWSIARYTNNVANISRVLVSQNPDESSAPKICNFVCTLPAVFQDQI